MRIKIPEIAPQPLAVWKNGNVYKHISDNDVYLAVGNGTLASLSSPGSHWAGTEYFGRTAAELLRDGLSSSSFIDLGPMKDYIQKD